MQFLIIVILICFFFFLFVLHFLSRDDFVLLRKDISTEKVFNIAFAALPISLFFGRALYVINNPSSNFLNPLYFLLFPYFPGLSLIGAILGTSLFLYIIFRSKKMPIERLLDLFTFSLSAVMPLAVVGYFALNRNIFSWVFLFIILSYVAIFIFNFVFFLPRFLKGRIKEGSVSLVFLFCVCAFSLLGEIISKKIIFNTENIVYLIVLLVSLGLYIKREDLISKLFPKK